jgi:hypothetical protein
VEKWKKKYKNKKEIVCNSKKVIKRKRIRKEKEN